jgi:CheY-like chemotaxis protein
MISSSDILHGKILIVDDQESNVILLDRMLVSAGYTSVASTINPRAVFELHRRNRYDLILLDLEMPGMDGFEVMEDLKKIEPQDLLVELPIKHQFQVKEGLEEIEPGGYLPVIVITAHPGHKLRALQAGAMDFISKPFELAEVRARVRNMLDVRLLHLETRKYINALEQKIMEVEASRALIRRQSDEVKRLQEQLESLEIGDLKGDKVAAYSKPQGPDQTKPHTLLYIENKSESLKLIRKIISRIPDVRLLTAVSGKIGINSARASLPDVIMTDINLHDISGFKVLEILLSDPATAHIPVIALSANAMPINIESGLEAGFFRYLTKPIKIDEFMIALKAALEISEKKPVASNLDA